MNKVKTTIAIAALVLSATFTSCNKPKDGEVIENTYSGNVSVTSTGSDPAGDFTGDGDAGTYKFGWENPKSKASLNFDITSPTGSVQFILEDKKGTEVLNETLYATSGPDTFSGVSSEGEPGVWVVSIILTDFDGDGSYSIHPGE